MALQPIYGRALSRALLLADENRPEGLARKLFDLEAGIGFGLTNASDKLVLKTIFAHTF